MMARRVLKRISVTPQTAPKLPASRMDLKKKNSLLQLELRNANKHIEYLTQLIPDQQVKQFGMHYLDG